MCRKLVYVSCCFLVLGLGLGKVTQAADPTLIGYWPLDEDSGDTAFDLSGYGNDGALSTDLEWQPAGGQRDGALLWTGESSAHVEISASEISPTAGSVMMWANLSEPQPAQTRYFFGHTTQPSYNNRIQLYMDGSNTELDLGLGGAHAVTTNMIVLETQRWYHVAMTWNAGSYVVYIDGEVISNGSYSGLATIHDFAWIGNDGNPVSEGIEGFGGLLDEVALYSRAVTQEEVQYVMNGGLGTVPTASEPSPEDGAVDVHQDAVLSWVAGKYPGTHDVYFGTVFDDVSTADRANPLDVLMSEGQADAAYDPDGLLDFGQVYYWRIDEVNDSADGTIYKGDVWSFTAEPLSYPIEGIIASDSISGTDGDAQNTVNGSGLSESGQHSTSATDMWLVVGNGVDPVWIQFEFDRVYQLHEMQVWNYNILFELVLGFGLKDVTIESSVDGVEWTVLADAEFAQATATSDYTYNTTVDLGRVMAKYIRLTANSAFGVTGQFGLSEVQFLQIPGYAREPQPADGAADVSPDALLSWRAGRGSVSHSVSIGTDPEALAVVDTVTESSYDPGALNLGTAYYWKIDEINETAVLSSVEGNVWSFTTQEFLVVDDFESYDDEDNAIFDAWIDGFVNDTGSTVGYFNAPFAERTIVYSGDQSMPLEYANDAAPFYSEAELDVGGADWTAGGADTLRLYVQGSVDNGADTLYVAVEDSAGNVAVATHPDGAVLTADTWQEWLIPYSDLGGVNLGRVAMLYIGIGDRDNPSAGGAGLIFIDDVGFGKPAAIQ